MDPKAYSFLDVEVRDNVAFVTMTHPDYDHQERTEIPRMIADVEGDSEVHVLLFSGWGNPRRGRKPGDFDDFNGYRYWARARAEPVRAFQDLDKPVVMAVEGEVGQLTIPLSGDIVIVERQCRFSDGHVLIGTASATQPYLWPLNSGLMKAKRYLLTGDSFSAEEGLEMGLFTEVVETGAARARAEEYALKLATLRPDSLQATKNTLNQWMRLAYPAVFDRGLALEFLSFPSDFSDRYRRGEIGAGERRN